MHADVDGKNEILLCGTNSWLAYVEVIAGCLLCRLLASARKTANDNSRGNETHDAHF